MTVVHALFGTTELQSTVTATAKFVVSLTYPLSLFGSGLLLFCFAN